jgi:hypothetical protein
MNIITRIEETISELLIIEEKLINKKINNIEKVSYNVYLKLFDTSKFLYYNINSLLYNLKKIYNKLNSSGIIKDNLFILFEEVWLNIFNYLIVKDKIKINKINKFKNILGFRFIVAWLYTKKSFEYIETDIKLLENIKTFKKIYFSNDFNSIFNNSIKEIIFNQIDDYTYLKNNYKINEYIWYLIE